MNILIILAHPREGSLNHALAQLLLERLSSRHSIFFHDLYAEGFDPVLRENELLDKNEFSEEITKHCDELIGAEALIIIHPNWWGQPPAILKGWIDRVIRLGKGYAFEDTGEGLPVTKLALQHFFVFNTSNTPADREASVFNDPLQFIWKNCIADFLGAANFHRKMFSVVVTSSDHERKQWLDDCCREVLQFLEPV